MPPLLLIDAGNTRLKCATAEPRGRIHPQGDMATAKATRASIQSLAKKYPRHHAVLASVVPRLLPAFRRAFAGRLLLVNARSAAPHLTFQYPRPAELGADRLAAAIAAHALGKFPALIISSGTATAFTLLDGQGRLCGGAIAPGLQTQLAALLGATARLPATSLRPPRRLPATSTREAIRAGVFLGFQGGVKEIVFRLGDSLPPGTKPRLLLTGGHAPLLKEVFGPAAQLRPLLVFEGLHIMGTRFFAPKP